MKSKNNIEIFIRKRYEDLGFDSLHELAKSIGVSRQTLYNWIQNSSEIKISNLLRLARAIQVHPVSLLRIVTQEFISYPVHNHPQKRFDDSGFISETIPDNSLVNSGATFQKTWRIQNTGSSVWKGRKFTCQNDNEQLYVKRKGNFVPFHSCQLHTETPEIEIPTTKPMEIIELSVKFTAPVLPGRAISTWKITDSKGNLCYPEKPGYWCEVVVTGFY